MARTTCNSPHPHPHTSLCLTQNQIHLRSQDIWAIHDLNTGPLWRCPSLIDQWLTTQAWWTVTRSHGPIPNAHALKESRLLEVGSFLSRVIASLINFLTKMPTCDRYPIFLIVDRLASTWWTRNLTTAKAKQTLERRQSISKTVI